MSNNFYILNDDNEPVPCDDSAMWALWLNDSPKKRVAESKVGKYWVSTVFLGLDHALPPNKARPLLFETMIFTNGEALPEYQPRYETFEEALHGHKITVDFLESGDLP